MYVKKLKGVSTMPNEFNYCFGEEDDLSIYESDSKNIAPHWDGKEWSDEDISECPGLDD